jgi:VWFA-related protein
MWVSKGAGQWPKLLAFCLAASLGWAQTQQNQQQSGDKGKSQDKSQDIPDAPSAVRPPQPFSSAPPPSSQPEPEPEPAPAPSSNRPPLTDPTAPIPQQQEEETPPPAPPLNIKTVPEGGATSEKSGATDQLFRITRNVNQVMVPVRVNYESSGQLVEGLQSNDFAVYENGKKQTLNYFTSDPFALSAAVILDLGMPDAAVQKVNRTYSALEGAFSQYDEVAVYTYSSVVGKQTDFTGLGKKLTSTFERLEYVSGRNNGPPDTGGPMGPQGPVINGLPIDPNVPRVMTPPQESHVLNDAILAAALDLTKRDKTRRRIIFVISDGREMRSTASYRDVLKVLLTNGIAVYGIGVGSAALPGYGTLSKLHLPRMGYTDILPKYSSATAGEYLTDNSRDAIESAYAKAIGEARNQYTLGYVAAATPSEAYREIEVTVARPDVKVYARDGYYSAAPSR